MMKYQKPEMEVIEFEKVSTITDSALYTDDSNTGGNTGNAGWGSF